MRGIQALFRGNRGPTTSARRHGSSTARTLTVLLGALSLMLSACSGGLGAQGGSGPLAKDQTFTWPYVTSTGTFGHNEVLDPAEISKLIDAETINMLYTGLMTFSPTYQVQYDAAQKLDVDPTATIYTFHLRPNLAFSDGKPITAADFAYSIDRSLSPTLCPTDSAKTYNANGLCYQAGQTYLSHILGAQDRLSGAISTMIGNGDDPKKGLDVLDAQTLRIRLDAPISYFLQALTYSTADAVEKSFIQNPQYAGGTWVDHLDQGGTSGPFKLQSYGDGTQMTFVPNPYWEKAFGQQLTLTKVIRPAISKTEIEYSDYQSNSFDYTDVPTSQYSFARGQSDFHSVPALETDYFGLNTKVAPFNVLQVRQAFDLALNKQLLVDRVENGGAIPTNHIVPQGMPGFDVNLQNPAPDSTQSLTGNQAAAVSLLKQAQANCPAPGTYGAPDYCAYITGPAPQEIDVYAPEEDQTRIQTAVLAAQEWSTALGLNVKVKPVSFNDLVSNIIKPATADPMGIWEIAWIADYPDPQDWLSLQFTTGAPNNSEGYSDPTFDATLKKADVEQNQATRMQLYNKAEQQVVDEALWIPYQQAKIYWRQREWVHGFGYNPGGVMVDINWPKVYISSH